MIVVLANQLLVIHSTLINVRNELAPSGEQLGEFQKPDDFIVNGLLASAITGLQSVQDGIASFCHREVRMWMVFVTFQHILFNKLSLKLFPTKRQNCIRISLMARISMHLLTNANTSFLGLGMSGVRIQDGAEMYYVHDITDGNHKTLFRGVVLPVFKETKEILGFLARKYYTHVDIPPI